MRDFCLQSYSTNLLLTSLISKLALLPHPYLHEYLLNPFVPLRDGVTNLCTAFTEVTHLAIIPRMLLMYCIPYTICLNNNTSLHDSVTRYSCWTWWMYMLKTARISVVSWWRRGTNSWECLAEISGLYLSSALSYFDTVITCTVSNLSEAMFKPEQLCCNFYQPGDWQKLNNAQDRW